MAPFRALALAALMAVLSSAPARAADLIYSMTGGSITGTLNGVAFNLANYSIATTANTSGIQAYTILGVVPSSYLMATTSMTISGFAPFTFSDAKFGIASANVDAVSTGNSLTGFATQLGTDNSTGLGPLGPGTNLPLNTTGSFTGELITFTGLQSPGTATWATSAGTLNITAVSGNATVTIANVPEPGSFVLAALAGAVSLLAARVRVSRPRG